MPQDPYSKMLNDTFEASSPEVKAYMMYLVESATDRQFDQKAAADLTSTFTVEDYDQLEKLNRHLLTIYELRRKIQ